MRTKIDIILAAYSRARVSGLTSQPTPADLNLALRRLEGMMAQWEESNICVDYNFEDSPNLNSLHNVVRGHWDAMETALALRTLSDFGKEPTMLLGKAARGAYATLLQATAETDQIPYPNRQPVGSGNTLRRNRFRRYYRPLQQAPNDCQLTNDMHKGDIDIFVEHFDAWLGTGETVASYTIETETPTNLTISADSLTSPDVTYTVEANSGGTYTVIIVATSSFGRITTRVIFFQFTEA